MHTIFDVSIFFIIIISIANFIIGAIWYSIPVVSKAWLKGTGDAKKMKRPVVPFIVQLIATVIFTWFILFVLESGYVAVGLATVTFVLISIATDLFRGTHKNVILVDTIYRVIMVVVTAVLCSILS